MPNAFSLAGITQQIFVSPSGAAEAAGTLSNPRTLKAVIEDATIAAGTVVWLRAGTHTGPFTQVAASQNGTAKHPIIYMPYADEHAIVNGKITSYGNSIYYVGLDCTGTGSDGGISIVGGNDVRIIDCTIHSFNNSGIGGWNVGSGHVYYGNLIWDIANDLEDPTGHAIYTQNVLSVHGTKRIENNIMWGCPNYLIHAYGEGGTDLSGFVIKKNIWFRNDKWCLLGGGSNIRVHDCSITWNYSYSPDGAYTFQIGKDGPTDSVTFSHNYSCGSSQPRYNHFRTGMTVTHNTIIHTSSSYTVVFDEYQTEVPEYDTCDWDSQTYYRGTAANPDAVRFLYIRESGNTQYTLAEWQALTGWDANSLIIDAVKPTENKIVILPNEYDAQRTHIAIYNWAADAVVSLTAPELGLSVGDTYRLLDTEDYYGASVLTGTYASGTIDIPIGAGNEFKTYILINEGEVRNMSWLSGWNYRYKDTIPKENVTGSHASFPVLWSRTLDIFKDAAHGGHVAQSAGQDFFVAAADGITQLPHEIDYYDPETGQVFLHIALPTLGDADDVTIYVYYGNATCGDQQNKTAVSDVHHKMAQHMNDDPDSSHVADSTSNGYDGTKRAADEPIETTGKIGKGQDFNGTTAHINFGTCDNSIFKHNGAVTLSAWIRADGLGEGSQGRIFNRTSSGNAVGPAFNMWPSNRLAFRADGATDLSRITKVNAISLSTWHYVTLTWDGSVTAANAHIYVDGAEVSSYTTTTNGVSLVNNAADSLCIGGRTTSYNFDGKIDEARCSDSVRSADWIKTEFDNQDDPGAFFTAGGEGHKDPTCQIDAITPSPAVQGDDTVSFTGTVTDVVGSITAYEWSSDIDGVISTSEDFTKAAADLSIGTHAISFRVKDNDDQWSDTVTGELIVAAANASNAANILLLGM